MSNETIQWFKNGDHPEDGDEVFEEGQFKGEKYEGRVVRYFRHPSVKGNTYCHSCNQIMHLHGWLDNGSDGNTVCPGDYIIKVNGVHYPSKKPIAV